MPTSRAGTDARPQAGFSLVELLAVLVVLALAGGVVMLRLTSSDRQSLAAITAQAASQVRQARDLAITSGRDTIVSIDLELRTLTSSGSGKPLIMPSEVDLDVVFASAERASETRAGLRFFPDGGSSGGSIRIGRDGSWYEVRVNWFTGHVVVVAPDVSVRSRPGGS